MAVTADSRLPFGRLQEDGDPRGTSGRALGPLLHEGPLPPLPPWPPLPGGSGTRPASLAGGSPSESGHKPRVEVHPFARVVPPVTGKRSRGYDDPGPLPTDLRHRDKKMPAGPGPLKPRGGPDPASRPVSASSTSGHDPASLRRAPAVRIACEQSWELQAQAKGVSVDDILHLYRPPDASFDDGQAIVCRHKAVEWALRQHELPSPEGDPAPPCIRHVDLDSAAKIRAWIRPDIQAGWRALASVERATVVSDACFGSLLSDRARNMERTAERRRVMLLSSHDHVFGLRLDRFDGARAGQSRWAAVMWDCNRPMVHRVCEVDEPAELAPSSLRDWLPPSMLRLYFKEQAVAVVVDVPPPPAGVPASPDGEPAALQQDPASPSTQPSAGSSPGDVASEPDPAPPRPLAPPADPFAFVDPQDIGSPALLRMAMGTGEPRLVARTLQALKDRPGFGPASLPTDMKSLQAALNVRSDPAAARLYIDFALDPELPFSSSQRAGVLRELEPEVGLPLLTILLREMHQDAEDEENDWEQERAGLYLRAITRAPEALIDPDDRVQLLLGPARPVAPSASKWWTREPGYDEPALHQLILRDCKVSCRVYMDAIMDPAARLLPAQRLEITSIRSSQGFTPLGMALQAGNDGLYTLLASEILEAPPSVVPSADKLKLMRSREGPDWESHLALALRGREPQLLGSWLTAILDPAHRFTPAQRTELLVQASTGHTAWSLACASGYRQAVEVITQAVLSAEQGVLPDRSAVLLARAPGTDGPCLWMATGFARAESQCVRAGRHLQVALNSPALDLAQKLRLCASEGGTPATTAARQALSLGSRPLAQALVAAIQGSTLAPAERQQCLEALGLTAKELQSLEVPTEPGSGDPVA